MISLLAASPSPSPSTTFLTGTGQPLTDDTVSPGWLGLVVFLVLALALVVLLRSFRHQLAKVPPSFPDPPAEPPAEPAEPAEPPADDPSPRRS